MTDFSAVREMTPYLSDPPAMAVGTPGKSGYLHLGFELDASGRSILRDWERRAPLIVQQALYFDEQLPDLPCVYILSSGGPNVDGDRYEQHITVRRGASAHVSTGAATKLAAMRYNFSALRQTFRLEAGAYLEFLPEPTIPCRRTRFWSDTEFRVDPSATLFYSEIYLAGRRHHEGERFAYDLLSVASRAYGPDERLLFREKFVIRPAFRSPETRGAMGGYDVFANAVVLTPPACAEAIYAATECISDPQRQLATGILRLPDGCGLSFRVLGMDSGTVKQAVRDFCSTVRRTVKGRPLPPEFPWR